MIPTGYNIDMDEYETSQGFQRDLIHSIWTSNDKVMTLGSLRKRRRELKSDQFEHFVHSVFIIISKVFFLEISRFYTLRAFQLMVPRTPKSKFG